MKTCAFTTCGLTARSDDNLPGQRMPLQAMTEANCHHSTNPQNKEAAEAAKKQDSLQPSACVRIVWLHHVVAAPAKLHGRTISA